MTIDVSTTGANKTESPKKPYGVPTLRVYGDIREVTKTIGATSDKNDGGGGKDKTS